MASACLGFAGFGWPPLSLTVLGFVPRVPSSRGQAGRSTATTTFCCDGRRQKFKVTGQNLQYFLIEFIEVALVNKFISL